MPPTVPLTLRASKPVPVPARPLGGRPFAVRLTVVRSDTAAPVPTGSASCKVTYGWKKLTAVGRVRAGRATCTMVIPKSARGKRLRGTVRVTFKNVSVAKSFSYVVR